MCMVDNEARVVKTYSLKIDDLDALDTSNSEAMMYYHGLRPEDGNCDLKSTTNYILRLLSWNNCQTVYALGKRKTNFLASLFNKTSASVQIVVVNVCLRQLYMPKASDLYRAHYRNSYMKRCVLNHNTRGHNCAYVKALCVALYLKNKEMKGNRLPEVGFSDSENDSVVNAIC